MMPLFAFILNYVFYSQINKVVSGPRVAGVIGERGSRESEYVSIYNHCYLISLK